MSAAAAYTAIARVRSSPSSNSVVISDSPVGEAIAPPRPWTARPASSNGKFAATLSAGVAAFPGRDVRDADELLRAADYALQYAKRAGKNRVCGFQQQGLVYGP